MFATVIRHLIDQNLTSVKELEQITGRGSSTVYRWLNGEGEPYFGDMRKIVRQLASPEARRSMVQLLSSDLPIHVEWIDTNSSATTGDTCDPTEAAQEIVSKTLLALHCLTDLLAEQHEAIRREEDLDAASYLRLVNLFDDCVRHLTISRTMLARFAPKRGDS